MAQNFKPIIDEIRSKLSNKEQLRETVLQTLKTVADQAKDSKLVTDYVIPAVESEQADKALKFLNSKLGTNPLVSKLELARKSIIDLKVSKAKPAAETAAAAETATAEVKIETASETTESTKTVN